MVGTSRSGNRFSKDHGLLLFLPPELTLALAKVQVQKEIGRSYSGLYALTVGCHQLGVLLKEQFEVLERRYSEKLVEGPPQKPLSPGELMEKRKLETKDRHFLSVLDVWDKKDLKWRLWHLADAQKYPQLPHAQKILELASKETTP